jgi:hypothetical protein
METFFLGIQINRTTHFLLLVCGLYASCGDAFSKRHNIVEPYFVELDPGAAYQTLYFDLGDGNAIARVQNVKRAGHTDKFIIAETPDGYYFIDRQKDNKFLNGNEIIGDPKTHEYFIYLLDSLRIEDFKFEYQ